MAERACGNSPATMVTNPFSKSATCSLEMTALSLCTSKAILGGLPTAALALIGASQLALLGNQPVQGGNQVPQFYRLVCQIIDAHFQGEIGRASCRERV